MSSEDYKYAAIPHVSVEEKSDDSTQLQKHEQCTVPVNKTRLAYGEQFRLTNVTSTQQENVGNAEDSPENYHLIPPNIISNHLITPRIENQHHHRHFPEQTTKFNKLISKETRTQQFVSSKPTNLIHRGITEKKYIGNHRMITSDSSTHNVINPQHATNRPMPEGTVRSLDESTANFQEQRVHSEPQVHQKLFLDSIDQNKSDLFPDPLIKRHGQQCSDGEFQNNKLHVNSNFKQNQNNQNYPNLHEIIEKLTHRLRTPADGEWLERSKICIEKKIQQNILMHHEISNRLSSIKVVFSPVPKYSLNISKKRNQEKSELKSRKLICRTQRPHVCGMCQKKFIFKSSLNKHVLIHKLEKCHVCGICQKRFTFRSSLNKHMFLHSGENPHECNILKNRFIFKNSLDRYLPFYSINKYHFGGIFRKRHSEKQTVEDPHNVDNDQKRFSPKNDKDHLFNDADESSRNCHIGHQRFTQKRDLNTHMLSHTLEKPHKYYSCKKELSEKSSLDVHLLDYTEEKTYHCHTCQKKFTRKDILNRHSKIHTGQKPHKCNICQKTFAVKGNLTRHLNIHTREKFHKCDTCQKIFYQKSHLKYHLYTHSGEKPYNCDICQKKFNRKSHLTTHLTIHTGERPHKCDICKKKFNLKSNLTRHLHSHSTVKAYKCDICQKTFKQKYTLKNHMIIHVSEKRY